MRARTVLLGVILAALLAPATAPAATPISTNGTPAPFSISPSQKVASWSFTGAAGEQVDYGLFPDAGFTIAGSPTFSVQDTSGHVLGSYFGTSFARPIVLPANGTYLLVLNGDGSTATGTVEVYAYFNRTGTIRVNGPRVRAALAPGQTATYAVHGTAGQTLGVDLHTGRAPAADANTFEAIPAIFLTDPSGNALPLSSRYALSATGVYHLTVTGGPTRYSLRVVSPPDHPAGTIAIGGPIAYLTISDPHQMASLTFRGRAGEQVKLDTGIFADSFMGGVGTPTLSLLGPGGQTLVASPYFSGFGPVTLPTTGTYTLRGDPAGAATGTVGLRLTRTR